MEVGHADASGKAWNLGVVPLDRKGDGGASQHAEVVGVVSVLPDIFAGEDYVLAEGLLQAGVELVAPTRAEWRDLACRGTAKQRRQDQGITSVVSQHQVLVEGSLQNTRVGNSKHRVGLLYVVGDSDAGLGFAMGGQAVIEITPQSEIE